MDRIDGRFSSQYNDFNKHHPYNDHAYSMFCSHEQFVSGNQQSIKIRSTDHSSGRSFTEFPSPDDLAKCSLMNVFQVAEPILKKLLICITQSKTDSDTLETYALKQGMGYEWFKSNFSDDQINIIRQNLDFDKFDLTLKCRCMEVFKDFNQTLINNKQLKVSIVTTLRQLKNIRNNLFHNTEHLSKLQCHDIAHNLKVLLGELLHILCTWNEGMDIITEKKKIQVEIDKIMNGGISKGYFRYMCLQKVLNTVVEPALNKVTQLICNDKKEDNFKKYFLRKGMKSNKYRDKFFKKEKIILESDSEKMRPDVTLHAKIIEICKEWHHLLKYDSEAKEELTSLIRKIRGIRNHISHNILFMSPNECIMEAIKLGDSMKDLEIFIQNQKNTMKVDAPIIDINQIYSDIHYIMSVPYPYL